MERPLITPSSINDLMDCAKKFNVLRMKREWPVRPTVHQGTEFGIAIHTILKHVYNPTQSPIPNLEDLDVWARNAFYSRRYADAVARDSAMQRGIQIVRSYAEWDEDGEATIDVEAGAPFPILHEGKPLFDVYARLDRVLVRPQDVYRLVVRDYKCGNRSVNLLEAYVLLRVAKLLYPGYKQYVVEFDFLPSSGCFERVIVAGATLKGLDRIVRNRVIEVFSAGDFLAQPGTGCEWCVLKEGCQSHTGVTLDAFTEEFEEETDQ